MNFNLTFLFLLVVLFSCKNETPKVTITQNDTPVSEATMTLKSQKYIKIEGDCSKACSKFSISYPEIKGGNSDFQISVQEWVMAWVRDNVISSEDNNKVKRMTLEETNVEFSKAFQTEFKERPENFHGFEIENKDTILCQNSKVVSLRMDCYANMGGAHPSMQTSIANFDPNTGGPIFVNKVIKDEKAILNMLEKKYIALKSEQSGEKFKIQTDNGKLTFPTNWGYTEKGILFHYNAYEVGSYAVGDADIFLTWEEMGAAAVKI
jgi:predicted transport protein